jgi:hypothetical protein
VNTVNRIAAVLLLLALPISAHAQLTPEQAKQRLEERRRQPATTQAADRSVELRRRVARLERELASAHAENARLAGELAAARQSIESTRAATKQPAAGRYVSVGMTVAEVDNIVGHKGELMSEAEGVKRYTYSVGTGRGVVEGVPENEGANWLLDATFENGKLASYSRRLSPVQRR